MIHQQSGLSPGNLLWSRSGKIKPPGVASVLDCPLVFKRGTALNTMRPQSHIYLLILPSVGSFKGVFPC